MWILIKYRTIWPFFTLNNSDGENFVNYEEMKIIKSSLKSLESKESKRLLLNKFNWRYFVYINCLILWILYLWEVDMILNIFLSEIWKRWKRNSDVIIFMINQVFIKVGNFINYLREIPGSGDGAIICVYWCFDNADIIEWVEANLTIFVSFENDILSNWNSIYC